MLPRPHAPACVLAGLLARGGNAVGALEAPTLASTCGASDKENLSTNPSGSLVSCGPPGRACQPDVMPLIDCLYGQNHLPGECCPHGVRDCPEPGCWMFRLRPPVEPEVRDGGQPEADGRQR